MDSYSIDEAAAVLGVRKRRIWELVARGVLAGVPEEGGGMRIFLQGKPVVPSTSQPDGRRETNGNGGGHQPPSFDATPFRELLTEFRNLTERYGQALLALGEARGEVAALRTRVELLEARVDLRLPSAAPPFSWAQPPAAAEAMPQAASSAPEPESAHEPEAAPEFEAAPEAGPSSAPEPEPAAPDQESPAFGPAAATPESPAIPTGPEAVAPEMQAVVPETMAVAPGTGAVADREAVVARGPAAPSAQTETDQPRRAESRARRRGDVRSAVAGLGEALARAEDPSLSILPGAEEAASAFAELQREVAAEQESTLHEPETKRFPDEPELSQPVTDGAPTIETSQPEPLPDELDHVMVAESVAASELLPDAFLADDALGMGSHAPDEPREEAAIVTREPDLEVELQPGALDAELAGEPEYEATASVPEYVVTPNEPGPEMIAGMREPELATEQPAPATDAGEGVEAATGPLEEAPWPAAPVSYSSEWDEPDWIAEEDIEEPPAEPMSPDASPSEMASGEPAETDASLTERFAPEPTAGDTAEESRFDAPDIETPALDEPTAAESVKVDEIAAVESFKIEEPGAIQPIEFEAIEPEGQPIEVGAAESEEPLEPEAEPTEFEAVGRDMPTEPEEQAAVQPVELEAVESEEQPLEPGAYRMEVDETTVEAAFEPEEQAAVQPVEFEATEQEEPLEPGAYRIEVDETTAEAAFEPEERAAVQPVGAIESEETLEPGAHRVAVDETTAEAAFEPDEQAAVQPVEFEAIEPLELATESETAAEPEIAAEPEQMPASATSVGLPAFGRQSTFEAAEEEAIVLDQPVEGATSDRLAPFFAGGVAEREPAVDALPEPPLQEEQAQLSPWAEREAGAPTPDTESSEPSLGPAAEVAPDASAGEIAAASVERGVEEEVMWLGAGFEDTTPSPPAERSTEGWGPPAASRRVSPAEDQALSRLAMERGWDEDELRAIRSLLAQPAPRAGFERSELPPVDTGTGTVEPPALLEVPREEPATELALEPGPPAAELDDEAFDWEQGPAAWSPPTAVQPSVELPGGLELDEAMAQLEPPEPWVGPPAPDEPELEPEPRDDRDVPSGDEQAVWAKASPQLPEAPSAATTVPPAESAAHETAEAERETGQSERETTQSEPETAQPAREPAEPERPAAYPPSPRLARPQDPDWLRGRRGPAADAYRRLRRLFPG